MFRWPKVNRITCFYMSVNAKAAPARMNRNQSCGSQALPYNSGASSREGKCARVNLFYHLASQRALLWWGAAHPYCQAYHTCIQDILCTYAEDKQPTIQHLYDQALKRGLCPCSHLCSSRVSLAGSPGGVAFSSR